MRIDGARADYQLLGYLGIGPSLCDQTQHVHLASAFASAVAALGDEVRLARRERAHFEAFTIADDDLGLSFRI